MSRRPSEEEQTRTAPLGLRIQPWLKEELETLARRHERKLANYIELVLKDHVNTFRGDKASGTKKAGRG
jgi:mRNA-degrading endonuclease RelE of RelBE toxin-antitoxin system